MQLLEDVREKAGHLCPGCRRPKEECIIYLTRHELDGFAALPPQLDADDHYARFYRRFRVAISRIDEEHLAGSAADQQLTTQCLHDALFGSSDHDHAALEAFGVPWHRQPPNSRAGRPNASAVKRLDYRIDTPTQTVFVELKNTCSPDDLGVDTLEPIVARHSGDAAPDTVFYLMTLHCGHTQRDYERYRRRFGSLAAYARHLNHVELRHVNLLPFYDNAESIVEFLVTIRG